MKQPKQNCSHCAWSKWHRNTNGTIKSKMAGTCNAPVILPHLPTCFPSLPVLTRDFIWPYHGVNCPCYKPKPKSNLCHIFLQTGAILSFKTNASAYRAWQTLPEGTYVAFRKKGDNRPIELWEFNNEVNIPPEKPKAVKSEYRLPRIIWGRV